MTVKELKIVVAGAGSIGCYIGGRLAAHGADVTLLLRPWLHAELDEHGIHISHLNGEQFSNPASLNWTVDPAGLSTADLILVTVKSGATESIAQTILEHAKPDAQILSLQNGVNNLSKLQTILTSFTVIGGMVPFNVVQLGQGQFRKATTGDIWVGTGGETLVEQFARWGVSSQYHPDIEGVHWGKLLINLNNPIQALSGIPLKEMLSRRDFRRVMAGAIDEGRAVYKAAGIEPQAAVKIPINWLPTALRLPDWIFHKVAKSVLDVDPAAQSSMWEDLQRGRTTEIDEINGVIVRLAQKHRIETPINTRLFQAIRQAEQGGAKVLSAAEMLGS